MEVWPGYDSSILKFESGAGLVIDVIHKMVSLQTVYDIMQDLYQRAPARFREDCMREVIGRTVMTR